MRIAGGSLLLILSAATAAAAPADTPVGTPVTTADLTASATTPVPVADHRRPAPGAVLRPAEIPEQNWLPGHRGVDLAAAPGTPIRASAAGTVRFAGTVAGTPTVSVDHGGGLRTTYEPVIAQVRTGDQVSRGTILGVLADSASLPDSARRDVGLHWGAVQSPGQSAGQSAGQGAARSGEDAGGDAERYLDPMTLLAPAQIRLWR